MASIHKNLIFDHLYISTNDEEFEEIKNIFKGFGCANHAVVSAEDDSWEGVYVQTRGKSYFEFLKSRRTSGLGICQSAYAWLSQNALDIMKDFPDLPWKTFERKMNGQKWYTAASCDNYVDLKTHFNTWVMQYHQRETGLIFPLKKYEITRIHEVYFSGNPNLVEKVKLNASWLNSRNQIDEKTARFELQTYYSDPLAVNITFDNEGEGFRFKKCILQLEPGIEFEDFDLRYFRFYRSGDLHILERK